MSDIPDWAQDNTASVVEQVAATSVPDWAQAAPTTKAAPVKPAPTPASVKPVRGKPTLSPTSAQKHPVHIEDNQGSIGSSSVGVDKTDITDEQAQGNAQLQSYFYNELPKSKRSDSQEADYLANTFYTDNDSKKRLQHRKELIPWIKYYRDGGQEPVGFYVDKSDLPDPIVVQGDKSSLNTGTGSDTIDAVGDFGRGMAGGLDRTLEGALELTAKFTDALGVTEGKEEDIRGWAGERNNTYEQDYVNPDGYARPVGDFVGSNLAFVPLAKIAPFSRMAGGLAGATEAGLDMGLQGGILSEVNSGGNASAGDVLTESVLAALAGGALHGTFKGKEAGDRYGQRQPRDSEAVAATNTDEQDVQTLAEYGIKPEDLPEGITPSDAVTAIHKAKGISNEAEAFKSSVKEPTAEDAFVNPDKNLATLEAKLKTDAENFSGKPLEAAPVDEPVVAPVDEAGISKKNANAQFAEATASIKKLSPKEMEAKLKAEAEAFVNKGGISVKPVEAAPKAEATKAPEQTQEAPSEAPKAPDEVPATSEPDEVTTRLIDSLERASKARPEQEALYKQERAARAARARDIPAHIQGKERSDLRSQIMSGELPKADFEEIGSQFTPEDIGALHDKINTLDDEFEKLTAVNGMGKILQGTLPTPSEIAMLSKVFDPKFVKAILQHRSTLAKSSSLFLNFAGSLKSIKSTLDLSAPLRQGAPLIHRKEYWQAFYSMFKYAVNTKSFEALENRILNHPNYQRWKNAGLFLSEHGHDLANREEAFMNTWLDKTPISKHSNQAYTGFLNQLRFDTANALAVAGEKAGIEFNDADLAHYINVSTGRGKIGALEPYATALNVTFYSPRFLSSRLTVFNPMYYKNLDPFARKQAIKSLIAYGTVAGTTMELARLAGFDVSFDPSDKAFAKITVGKTHYDVGAGYGQIIRFAVGLSADTYTKGKSFITTGELPKNKWGQKTEGDEFLKFVRSKSSPVAGFATDWLTGSNAIGEPFTVKKQAVSLFGPLFLQDYADLVNEEGFGLKSTAMALPGLFGAGMSTYPDRGATKAQPLPKGTPTPDWGKDAGTPRLVPEEVKAKVSNNSPDWSKKASLYETSGNANAIHLAEKLGFHVNDAGIRSIEDQRYYYANYKGTAKPGTSPHGQGKAIDLRPKKGTTPAQVRQAFVDNGYKGVKIITKLHGTGPHWHVQWDNWEG